jgi:hypothetical protein
VAGATIVKTDSLLVSRPFQYIEYKTAGLKTIKIYAIDMSKHSSAQKGKMQIEEQGPGNHGNNMNGTVYVSYGIGLIITLIVIILL